MYEPVPSSAAAADGGGGGGGIMLPNTECSLEQEEEEEDGETNKDVYKDEATCDAPVHFHTPGTTAAGVASTAVTHESSSSAVVVHAPSNNNLTAAATVVAVAANRRSDANYYASHTNAPPPPPPHAFHRAVMTMDNQEDNTVDNNNTTPTPHRRNGILANAQPIVEDHHCAGAAAAAATIDIDQIKLERYRVKAKNVGVQTTHLSPYRLRFWPVAASIKCLDASFTDVLKCCLRTLSQWFLSQVGLTCVLIVWALLGATAFFQAEGPREREQAEQIAHHKNDIAIDLATDLRQLNEGVEANWPATIQKYLNKHESLLLRAVSSGYVEGGGAIWTYPGCVLFAVLLLTTLGFGAPVPRTSLGRGMAVLFSAIGIPLHFMLILNVSNLIAKRLQNLATIKPVGEIRGDVHEARTKRRPWYKWFPPILAVLYYVLGVLCFGVARQRSLVECLLFALDFTESGGVANTAGHVRILYALYIELAVILAATIMSMIQVSATNGVIDLGLRLGLLTNT